MGAVSDMTTVAPSSSSHAPTSSGLRTMATARSRSTLHSWMTAWPVVLLAAFRMTQSPGCIKRHATPLMWYHITSMLPWQCWPSIYKRQVLPKQMTYIRCVWRALS